MGVWKIIIPQEAINMVLNPVAMGSGNYTAINAATITLDTTKSYLGYRNFKIVGSLDNQGIRVTLSALTNAIHYVTVITNGAMARWDWSLDNVNFYAPTLYKREGDWYFYGVQFSAAQANGKTYLYIQSNASGAYTWYLGLVQVEAGTVPTTPIYGGRKGFTKRGFGWVGVAEASPSKRRWFDRSGGIEKDLDDDFLFKVRYGVGIGMPTITHRVQELTEMPGALFQGSKIEPRALDLLLVTDEEAPSPITVAKARRQFINAIKADLLPQEQPCVFRYYGANPNQPTELYGNYLSGGEFSISDGMLEKPTVRFMCYDPAVHEAYTQGKAVAVNQAVATADYGIRKVDGAWSKLGSSSPNGYFDKIWKNYDGNYLIGGNFTGFPNIGNNYMCRYNPYTNVFSNTPVAWVAFPTAVVNHPNGASYVFNVQSIGGVNLYNCGKNAAGTFNMESGYGNFGTTTFPNGSIWCAKLAPNNRIWIGGTFTNIIDAYGDYLCYTDGTTISNLGASNLLNGAVYDIAFAPNGDLIVVGNFTSAGGNTNCKGIARWDGVSWKSFGTGITGPGVYVYSVVTDPAGNVYAGGINMTSADGVVISCLCMWNGKTFDSMAGGVAGTGTGVGHLIWDSYRDWLYVIGNFTSAGGIPTIDSIVVWNGSTYAHFDVNLPGSAGINDIELLDDDLYITYDTAGTAYTSALTLVANMGSMTSYPTLKIKRSGGTSAKLWYVKNETTGDTLLCNYDLMDGETITIDLTPGNKKCESDVYGNVWRAILRASDVSTFRLLPGDNNISVFVDVAGSPTMTAYLEWAVNHWSTDMVAV